MDFILHLKNSNLIPPEEVVKFSKIVADIEGFNEDSFNQTIRKNNLNGISRIYKSISIPRLAQIIGGSPDEAANMIKQMIKANSISAQIDQPNEMIIFLPKKTNFEVQDESISEYAQQVIKCAQLIQSLQ